MMIGSRMLAVVLLLMLWAACSREESASKPQRKAADTAVQVPIMPPIPEGVLKHDQETIRHLLVGEGKMVVETASGFHEVNVDRRSAEKLSVPGMEKILRIGIVSDSLLNAFCHDVDKKPNLFARKSGKWERIPLPSGLFFDTEKGHFALSRDTIAVVSGDKAWLRSNGEWQNFKIAIEPTDRSPTSLFTHAHVLLQGPQLYLGYDGGEWGGCVTCLDIPSGKWDYLKDFVNPVTDIRTDSRGRLWIVEGVSHLLLVHGRALYRKEGTWEVFCDVGRTIGKTTGPVNWPFTQTPLSGLCFGESDGALYLLTPKIGVVQYLSGQWHGLCPQWPNTYVGCKGLLVLEGKAVVIATREAGIILWDMVKQEIVRIPLVKKG